MTLNMSSDDRRSLSFVTTLLQVRNRGQSLVGHMAYRSSVVDKVDCEEITWRVVSHLDTLSLSVSKKYKE